MSPKCKKGKPSIESAFKINEGKHSTKKWYQLFEKLFYNLNFCQKNINYSLATQEYILLILKMKEIFKQISNSIKQKKN
jgi:hypothetical protein